MWCFFVFFLAFVFEFCFLLAWLSVCFTVFAYGLWRWYATHNHPAPL